MLWALQSISVADWLAFLQTAVVAAMVLTLALLAGRTGRIDKVVTRKALHIGMGGSYVLYWPLYSDAPYSRYLCAMVPYMATMTFGLVGLGAIPFAQLVRSATRGGARQELLTGPLLYGIVHVLLTVVFWSGSPAGVIAVAILCFGDGAAELVGRRASAKLWHNSRKTWAGSAACLLAGWLAATAYAFLFRQLGTFERHVGSLELAQCCALSALAAAAVESLPLEADNITVPLAAVVTSVWWLGF